MFKVTVNYVRDDGSIVDELTPEEQERFEQRLLNAAIPLHYEALMKELASG